MDNLSWFDLVTFTIMLDDQQNEIKKQNAQAEANKRNAAIPQQRMTMR